MMESDSDGGCQDLDLCRQEFLDIRSNEILRKYGGKDDNKALKEIIKVGAALYHTYDAMLPALTRVINGNSSAHLLTLYISSGVGPCDGLGRGKYNCATNEYSFADSGFHSDFQDNENNQLFHVWPYIANVGGKYSFGGVGLTVAQFRNWYHETREKGSGASWNDYFMSQAGMEIGVGIANGEIAPDELADFVFWRLGPDGPGSNGMVDSYTTKYGPLYVPSITP